MRNVLFSSLLAALLATVSTGALASTPAPAAATPQAASATMQQSVDKTNINTADAESLQKNLSGIGANKAAAIVAYREANGNFTSVDELLEVKGIGKTLLDRNRDRISLE
ncbi:helix-hairpin-helix domain-containing protein [Pseudomonas syringae]|nr:helix-hairpin-helix domain-containing protein [Pseudomonas syringae]MBD8574603.1 helix-hairpin-helix domain-containing protein [Pseudomonas syringae]MBD8789165.1 helix-hairpin-helix domain-containing protein [Pseudomonas syringae]MBD8800391.1 helix-hairpin-helix domain-containing protein [Pseudomonas syringae]MBD8810593.1 helix-hairpin-helix domain-containing protein [Pseudomonas syringae]